MIREAISNGFGVGGIKMRTVSKALVWMLGTWFVTSCIPQTKSEHGNARISDAKLVAQIEKGKSTKADVKRLLGEPMIVDFTDAGFEKWIFMFTTSQIKGSMFNPKADTQSDTLTIQFDKEGVVQNLGVGHTTGGNGEGGGKG